MALVVPLQPVPSQVVAVTLAAQPCKISVYQKRTGLYLDLSILDAPVVTGVICLDSNRLVRSAYLGFDGDLAFFDTMDSQDPTYDGLGSRYILTYLSAAEAGLVP